MSSVEEFYGFDPDNEAEVMEHACEELAEVMYKMGDDHRARQASTFMVYCAKNGRPLTMDQLRFVYYVNVLRYRQK